MKKFSILPILSLCLFIAPISLASFSDIQGIESSKAIEWMETNGVVEGYADNSFRPNQPISRAEFLKIVVESSQKTTYPQDTTSIQKCSATEQKNIGSTFTDISSTDWFGTYICDAYKSGIIQGYADKTFQPHQTISRAEAAKIVSLVQNVSVPNVAGEWHAPFLQAINNEKAVSNDFASLPNARLTRGEMADMTWRLITGNEKNTENTLQKFGSCSEVSAQLLRSVKRGSFEMGGGMAEIMPMVRSDMALQSKSVSSDASYSTTNIQEKNVDEADIVKNDASHIFVAKNNTVKIIKAYPASEMSEDTTITLEKDLQINSLYLQDNTLVVMGTLYPSYTNSVAPYAMDAKMIMPYPVYNNNTSEIRIFNVQDRKNPKQIRSASISGNIIESRITNGVLYTVHQNNVPYGWKQNAIAEDIMPKINGEAIDCSSMYYVPNFERSNITTVVALDINNPNEKITMQSILGFGNQIYASEKNLYLINDSQKQVFSDENGVAKWNWQEMSDIFKFSLNKTNISLVANGSVAGRAINQYAMSEHDGYFRIATQVGQAWGSTLSDNRVSILNEKLEKVSEITGIAKGENIKSVRFSGNKGFLVTFKTVDPLFVIDMTPSSPKILGELKIPGWSDYLHPIDETHLLGIGKEVDETIDADKVHDENAVYYTAVQGVKLAMFDVSDLKNPKEMYKTVIGERGTETEASYNPRSLFIDTTRKLVGFPIMVYQSKAEQSKCMLSADNTCSAGCTAACAPCTTAICPAVCKVQCVPENFYGNEPMPVFQGAMLFSYTDNAFVKQGEITHFSKNTSEFWNPELAISRLVRIGESFYSISQGMIKSLNNTLIEQKQILFMDTKQCESVTDPIVCSARIDCQDIYSSPACPAGMACIELMQFSGCKTK